MNTLTAFIEIGNSNYKNRITTLKDNKGFVKAILTGYHQPTRQQKTIIVNRQTFNLEFSAKKE